MGEVSDQCWEECLKLIERVKRDKNSVFFRFPVDPVRDQVSDYFDIIKKPMDLSTVEVCVSCFLLTTRTTSSKGSITHFLLSVGMCIRSGTTRGPTMEPSILYWPSNLSLLQGNCTGQQLCSHLRQSNATNKEERGEEKGTFHTLWVTFDCGLPFSDKS